jgi:hypothetical protein
MVHVCLLIGLWVKVNFSSPEMWLLQSLFVTLICDHDLFSKIGNCWVVPVHTMKALEESTYGSLILDLGTRWREVVSFKPGVQYPQGKGSRYSENWRLYDLGKKKISCPCREWNQDTSVTSLWPSNYAAFEISYCPMLKCVENKQTCTTSLEEWPAQCGFLSLHWHGSRSWCGTIPLYWLGGTEF